MCQNRIHSKRGSNNALISTRTFWMKKKKRKLPPTWHLSVGLVLSKSAIKPFLTRSLYETPLSEGPGFRTRKEERGLLTSFRRTLFLLLQLSICTSPIIHLVCPLKFCVTLAFNFSWVLQSLQEKLKTIFTQKILWGKTRCTCCTFYRLNANLFYRKWRNLRVWCHLRVILFNQTNWTWVIKRATSLFNSCCGNVSKQVARFCCLFYRSFTDPLFLSRKHFHLWKGSCHFHSLYTGVSNWPNNLVLISKEPFNTYNLVKFICLLIKTVIINNYSPKAKLI